MINKSRKTPIAFASIQTAGLGAISFGIFQIYQSNLLGGIIMVAVGWFLRFSFMLNMMASFLTYLTSTPATKSILLAF